MPLMRPSASVLFVGLVVIACVWGAPSVDDVVPELIESSDILLSASSGCPNVVNIWKAAKHDYENAAKAEGFKASKPEAWYQFGSSGIDQALSRWAAACEVDKVDKMSSAHAAFLNKRDRYLDASGWFPGPLGKALLKVKQGGPLKDVTDNLLEHLFVIDALMGEAEWRCSGHSIAVGRGATSDWLPNVVTSELAVYDGGEAIPLHHSRLALQVPQVFVGVFLGVPFFRAVGSHPGNNRLMDETWYPCQDIGARIFLLTERSGIFQAHRFDHLSGTEDWSSAKDVVVSHFYSMMGPKWVEEKKPADEAKLEQLLQAEWTARTLVDRWEVFPADGTVLLISKAMGGALWQTDLGSFVGETMDASFQVPDLRIPRIGLETERLKVLTPANANTWLLQHHATTPTNANSGIVPHTDDRHGEQVNAPYDAPNPVSQIKINHVGASPKGIKVTTTAKKSSPKSKKSKPKEAKPFGYSHFDNDDSVEVNS